MVIDRVAWSDDTMSEVFDRTLKPEALHPIRAHLRHQNTSAEGFALLTSPSRR
jgi:hypothetical protein